MTHDLVIGGGRLVSPSTGVQRGDIGVNGEKIASIGSPGTLSGERYVDASGKLVLPGVIDPHTHHGITRSLSDDARSESRSDLYGGVTTTGNFFRRGRSYNQVLESYMDDAEAEYHHDYFFSLGLLSETHLTEVPSLITEFGITSFKWYMNYKNRVSDKFGVDGQLRDDFGDAFLSALASRPEPTTLGFHSENTEITDATTHETKHRGRDGYDALLEAFPARAETQSLVAAAALAKQRGYDDSFYAVHISAGSTVDALASLQQAGYGVTGETCAHYLTFSADECDSRMKINPPIRSAADRARLWEGLRDGTIDCVGTDHCCKPAEVKFGDDIWETGAAFQGSPFLLPVILTRGVRDGRISLERAVEVTSTNTAKAWNLYPKKGTLAVGADADITIVDMDAEKEVTPELVDSVLDYSVYEGLKLIGWPTQTIVRGTVAYDDGSITVEPGHGTHIDRPVSSISS